MKPIPIAQPVDDKGNQPIVEVIAQPISDISYQNTQSQLEIRCRDCGEIFTRRQSDQSSSRYYRCQKCQDKVLVNGFCNSCNIQ